MTAEHTSQHSTAQLLEELISLWGSPSQKEVGERLGVAREYVNRVLKGHEPSDQFRKGVIAQIQFARSRQGANVPGGERPESGTASGMVQEDTAVFRGPLQEGMQRLDIRRKIIDDFGNLLAAAGGDVARLGWIAEQFATHLQIPPHWKKVKVPQVPQFRNDRSRALYSEGMRLMMNKLDREAMEEGHRLIREAIEAEFEGAEASSVDATLDEIEARAKAERDDTAGRERHRRGA